ncbi:MAG TPA: PD-(D/E)XK nuclease family protein [Vicinamibacterales bacterium]|jgi:ATP-dependent helicase/nuclease subunit B|nr:PD-(D/E)XK nuclease family protein [Vicinamibacterales bacterium]
MDPFVEQLRASCAASPTRAKWVFVRTHGIGRTIGDRLALSGTDWANLRFVTPLDIAVRMGAPFLVERGIDPSEDGLGPALVMRLLLDLPAGQPGYFRALADQPSMAAALWTTIRELRMAGIGAGDLSSGAFASPEKHEELVALVGAYERFLTDHARGDVATVFAEALRHLDWCPIQSADCWTEQPNVIWSPLERRLIDVMPGERIIPAAFDLPGATTPRRLLDARIDHRVSRAPLAFLRQPEAAPAASTHAGDGAAAAIELFQAGGAEAEVEETFRRILASGRSIDEVEIICARRDYAALVWEKAIRYDWPVTTAEGLPAAMTRPGRAVLAFTEWIQDDFAAGRLRRLLQSGDVRVDVPSLTSGQAARLLVRAKAAWGRATYATALGAEAASSRRRAAREDVAADERERLEARAEQATALAEWIDALIARVPPVDANGRLDLAGLAESVIAFLAGVAARTSALDTVAASALAEAIGDLRALGRFDCTLDRAVRFIRERVESVTVGVDRPRPGHLHVSSLSHGGYAGRPLVFVVGLEEGQVFPAPLEDAVLLDAERIHIASSLPLGTDRTDESVHAALDTLARMSAVAGGRVVLSYSCRDLREGRDTYASWILLQAYRVVSGRPTATYRDLHEHLGTACSCVPANDADALDPSRWWLHGVRRGSTQTRANVLAAYPSLAAGVAARAARESDRFTEFDGSVPAAGPVLDPCAAGRVMSVTQLEDAAACPFRYFLRRGLGVDAIEAGERDRDMWINALDRGSLLHDLYAQLLRRCRDGKRRATVALDADWLVERAEVALDELAATTPPPSAECRARETTLFLDDVRLFVEGEEQLDVSHTPVGVEVSFGFTAADETEALAQPDPVELRLGGDLALRVVGRIDRIDQVGPHAYEIVDYKTGKYWADDWQGTFAGGSRLQHALYGLAAVELLKHLDPKAHVQAAEYYFSSAKGQQQRTRIAMQPLSTIAGVLRDLRAVIASGALVHAADERACKWCHYAYACRSGAHTGARLKADDPQLAVYRNLLTHD